MTERQYRVFQSYCRKLKTQYPGYLLNEYEAWEMGINAVSSKVRDMYRSGREFTALEKERFFRIKSKYYQGRYKRAYLEAIKICLDKLCEIE